MGSEAVHPAGFQAIFKVVPAGFEAVYPVPAGFEAVYPVPAVKPVPAGFKTSTRRFQSEPLPFTGHELGQPVSNQAGPLRNSWLAPKRVGLQIRP